MSDDRRPERHALLELVALLDQIARRRDSGDRKRYDSDDDYRWAPTGYGSPWAMRPAFTQVANVHPLQAQPWGMLYRLRNVIAHDRLPDIDEDHVWRMTVMRVDPLRETMREQLR